MTVQKNRGGILLKLVVVLLVLAAAGVYVFTSFQRPAVVKAASQADAADAVSGSVLVDAEGGTRRELKSEAEGKVIACDKVKANGDFKAGEELVKLDTEDLDLAIREYQRRYRDDKTLARIDLTGGKPELLEKMNELSEGDLAKRLEEVNPGRVLAKRRLDDAERVYKLGNLSEEELNTAKRALEAIDLGLRKVAFNEKKSQADYDAQMKAYNLQRERMTVRAPSDGQFLEAYVWKGELIGRNHVIGRFMSPERLVTAKISEEDFGKVKVGQSAKVRFLTHGDRIFEAKVSKLAASADEAQKFVVFLDVQVDSPGQLRPNMTGEVTITIETRKDSVMVPRRALFDSDKLCVVKNGKVEKRKVKVGFLALNVVEILEGVAVGEHVVVEQPDTFRPGSRVRTTIIP